METLHGGFMVPQAEMPITVTTVTGTVVTVHASQETIEGYYGDVHKLVDKWIKPLHDVESIVIHAYDEFFDEVLPVVTYSKELEAWKARGERLVITYDFYNVGMEDEDRGYLDVEEGWLPRYAMRYQRHAKKKHPIATDGIIRIETAKAVNDRARSERNKERYHLAKVGV